MAKVIVLCSCALLLTACGVFRVASPVMPPIGFLFTNYRAPLQFDFDETSLGSKHGTGSVTHLQLPIYFYIDLAWGDVSVATVAREAGIQEVRYTDYELVSILGIFVQYKLHVYGD